MKVLFFVIGTIVGSFLNVCIYRIPKDKSIVFPSSFCTKCVQRLKAVDLIPVLSYLFLKGRCRYCSERISIRYPMVELLTGLIFLFIYIIKGFNPLLIKLLVQSSILIIITFIDLEYQIIPDKIVVFALIAGIILNIYVKDLSLVSSFMGFVIGGGVLLLIAIISGGAMGGGDVKLMAAMGVYLGWEKTLLALFLSFIIGGIVGVSLLLFKIKNRKDYIPFGPFLALGTFISSMFYNQIIFWYLFR